MSAALEVTDNLTTSSSEQQISSSVAVVDTRVPTINKCDGNSLSSDGVVISNIIISGDSVVINNIIISGSGSGGGGVVDVDDGQPQKSSFPSNPPHLYLPGTSSFWTPGLSPDDDIVNYGSCNMDTSLNQDEVDQIKQTFLDGGSNKLNIDIESLYTGQSNYHPVDRSNSKMRWWRHPKFKENWKIFFAAFGLLVVGIGLLTVGIVVSVLPDIDFQSYVFFIAGTICFIPGAYHVVYLYFALSGRKGYDFHQLPLFN